jgi:hypothetical protein
MMADNFGYGTMVDMASRGNILMSGSGPSRRFYNLVHFRYP